MSKKLNIFLTLMILLLAGGCADDDFRWQGTTVGSDEYLLAFTKSAPTVEVVGATRATDAERDAITELTLLVADAQGKLYKEPIHFTPGTDNCTLPSGTATGTVVVKKNQVTDGEWYLVANCKQRLQDYYDAATGDIYMEDLLEDITFDREQLFGEEKHVMIHHTDIKVGDETQAETKVFDLKRLYSRVTVEINKAGLPFVMTEARLSRMVENGDLNALPVSTISDAAIGTDGWSKPSTGRPWTEGISFTYANLNEQLLMASYPFKAAAGAANNQQIMLMVKGYFNTTNDNTNPEYDAGSLCYYAIQLPELKANHHLKVMINGADAKGKTSAAEAEANPGGLSVEFKDQSADIHNILSDGENVLAVPDTIRIEADKETWKFDIMARKAGSTAPTVTVKKIGTAASAWFTMPEDHSGWTVSDNLDEEASKQGLFTTRIEATGAVRKNEGSDRSCKYVVELDGTTLKREVVFLQVANKEVKYSKAITQFSLTIKHTDGTREIISDYLAFINPSVVEIPGTDRCLGIQPEENGARVRNLGIHMPMPNGGATEYTYNIRLGEDAKLYRILENGDERLETENSVTFVYSDQDMPGGGTGMYSYTVDTDKFVIRQGEVEYTLDLYHTGFFHKDGDKWLYYEVIKQDDKDLYWLDRNLGAESAGMGVRNATVLTSEGWPIVGGKAMGGRYTMEKQGDKYEFSGTCPEGWDVPSYAQMRSMTVANGFTINRMTTVPEQKTYFAPNFTFNGTENGRPTRIRSYFPQNRMEYDGNQNGGDPGAGYYLTTTSAGSAGWYQTMQFSGMNVTSQNSDMSKAKMSVRCCAGSYNPESTADNYTCVVKGFTHVFMYYLNEDGTKTYLTTWPGEQIAVSSDLNRFHPFEITPTMEYKKERLYVIFNKVEEGVWKDANVSDDKVKAREGVKFVDGGWYSVNGEESAKYGADLGSWVDKDNLPEADRPHFEYALKGNFNSLGWGTLADNQFVYDPVSKTWKMTLEVSRVGQFIIQRKMSDATTWSDWGNNANDGTNASVKDVDYGTAMGIHENRGSGWNWKFTLVGETTLVLDEAAKTLTVTCPNGTEPEEGSDDIPDGYAKIVVYNDDPNWGDRVCLEYQYSGGQDGWNKDMDYEGDGVCSKIVPASTWQIHINNGSKYKDWINIQNAITNQGTVYVSLKDNKVLDGPKAAPRRKVSAGRR